MILDGLHLVPNNSKMQIFYKVQAGDLKKMENINVLVNKLN